MKTEGRTRKAEVRGLALLCVLCVSVVHSAFASTLYVDCAWGNNGYDGTTNVVVLGTNHGPKLNITGALSAASSGDVLRVAQGIYQEVTWDAGAKTLTIIPDGTVTIYGSDPWQTDSVGDGISDGWRARYFGDGLTTNSGSCASCDPDGDEVSNLQEYLNGTNPLNADNTAPVITVAPTPNEAGWFRTNVVIQFTATDAGSGVAWVSPSMLFNTETNDAEVIGMAVDNAGNVATEYASVNIDQTPPTLELDPGNGDQFDNSHPLLIVHYSDPVGTLNTTPSGLDLSSLKIALTKDTMDDVTTNFYRFAGRAIWCTNLSAGTYTWSATIFDYAGNSVTSTVSFYATGQPNPDAPAISDLNLTDDVTLMPDTGQIWLQGNVTGDGATVYASVNGGGAIRMNQRDGLFGSLLPLETGTNVVVIMAGDGAGANVSSRVLLIVRSDKFQAAVSSPTLGAFANGASLTASGTVSDKFAVGTDGEMGLSSITINGVEAMLGPVDSSGNRTWSTVDPINLLNGHANTNALSVNAQLCWTNGTALICKTMPLGLIEGYEITELKNRGGSVNVGFQYNYVCTSSWLPFASDGLKRAIDFELGPSGSGWTRRGGGSLIAQGCAAEPEPWAIAGWYVGTVQGNPQPYPDILFSDPDPWDWDGPEPQPMDASMNFVRGLSLGTAHKVWIWDDVSQSVRDYQETGSMTFRMPAQYGQQQPVIFTLEGVKYGYTNDAPDLSELKLKWDGEWHTPVTWNWNGWVFGGTVGYFLLVDGGATVTLNEDAFNWPAITDWVWNDDEEYSITSLHWLSFKDFHNEPAIRISPPEPKCELGGSVDLTATLATGLNPSSVTWSVEPTDAGTFSTTTGATTTFNLRLCAQVEPKPKITATLSVGGSATVELTPTTDSATWQEIPFRLDCPSEPCKYGTEALGSDDCDKKLRAKCECHGEFGTLYFYYQQFEFGECCYQDGARHRAWVKVQTNATGDRRIVALFHYNSNIPPKLGYWKWRVRMYDCLHPKGNFPTQIFSKCGSAFFEDVKWGDPRPGRNPNGTEGGAHDCSNCVEAN
jgi:hypothetical protein